MLRYQLTATYHLSLTAFSPLIPYLARMKATTVIFDMDGLLIDSEPLWEEAGAELLQSYGVELTSEQYQSSTGLRTREWITHWFNHFHIDNKYVV